MKKEVPLEIKPTVLPGWLLLATIFITGNVVMMLEVAGTRVIGPFFGVGLYVWSALITVTLLALAIGYWLGGQWADRRSKPELLYLIILGAAVLIFLIPLLRNPLLTAVSALGLRLGSLVGAALLFGPALLLLGMVTPFATKLYTERFEKLGSRVGFLYALSTLGSFAGTIAMGFYLIPTFRLSMILVALSLGLLVLPILFFGSRRIGRAIPLLLLAVLLGVMGNNLTGSEAQVINHQLKIIYKSTSYYGELKVVEVGSSRMLLVDGIYESGQNYLNHQALPEYIQTLDKLLQRYQPAAKQVLVIGLGGGDLIHTLHNRGVQVEVVEIAHQVVEAAEKYFAIDPREVKIVQEDGRRFIRSTHQRYDAIILNAFVGENSPTHLLSREFFQEVKRALNPGGIVAANFVGAVQGPDAAGAAVVYTTLKATYQWCRTYYQGDRAKYDNILYVAGDGRIAPEPAPGSAWDEVKRGEVTIAGWQTAPVCTDDYNPVDFLNRQVYRRWRQDVMDTMGPEVLLN